MIVVVFVPHFTRMPPSVARKEPADAHAASQALIQAERFEKGSTVWIEDEEEAWAMVRILGQENTLLRVCNVETGEEKEIDLVSFGVLFMCCLPTSLHSNHRLCCLFCMHSCRVLQMCATPIPKWLLT